MKKLMTLRSAVILGAAVAAGTAATAGHVAFSLVVRLVRLGAYGRGRPSVPAPAQWGHVQTPRPPRSLAEDPEDPEDRGCLPVRAARGLRPLLRSFPHP
jgi:hypothetical protein